MITQYFKQTWAESRRNPLFTSLYVSGVALAVATVMVFSIIYYVKLAPVYPEYSRERLCYFPVTRFATERGGQSMGGYSPWFINGWFRQLKNAEVLSVTYNKWDASFLTLEDGSNAKVVRRFTDPQFFEVYDYRLMAGRRFAQADFDAGRREAVVSDGLARRLFGSVEAAVGKDITLDNLSFHVVGVFEEPSRVMEGTFVEVIAPYTAIPGWDAGIGNSGTGSFIAVGKVKDGEGLRLLREEIDGLVQQHNAEPANEWKYKLPSQPQTHMEHFFDPNCMASADGIMKSAEESRIADILFMLAVLLFVPALNLSGMIAGRMEWRCGEMGIRKSFGATRGRLLRQVLAENMILTLAGGLGGLVVAWILLALSRSWIFGVLDSHSLIGGDVSLSGEMLFAPAVFAGALAVCLVLNLLSALIPAWWSLRRPIVSSLNEKR